MTVPFIRLVYGGPDGNGGCVPDCMMVAGAVFTTHNTSGSNWCVAFHIAWPSSLADPALLATALVNMDAAIAAAEADMTHSAGAGPVPVPLIQVGYGVLDANGNLVVDSVIMASAAAVTTHETPNGNYGVAFHLLTPSSLSDSNWLNDALGKIDTYTAEAAGAETIP